MSGRTLIRAPLPLVVAALASLLAACGGSGGSRDAGPLTVLAAASLTDVLPAIDPRPRYTFAGSDTLLTQIEQGAPADVFASANTAYPDQLYREGKCGRPVVYATNRLVVAVPKGNPAGVRAVHDLARPGVKVLIAAQGVPVGDYTREVLAQLGLLQPVLANVVSEEPDVKSVLAKIVAGEADAGFVYATDARPVQGQVEVTPVPAAAQPPVRYAMCVPTSSGHPEAAQAFVARVTGEAGRAQLEHAGFGLP